MDSHYDVKAVIKFIQATIKQNLSLILMFQIIKKKVSEELFKQAIDLLIIAYEELALTEVNPEKTKYIRKSLMNFDTCLKKFKEQSIKMYQECQERKELYDIESEPDIQCSFCDEHHVQLSDGNPQSCPNYVKNWSQ